VFDRSDEARGGEASEVVEQLLLELRVADDCSAAIDEVADG
jgi:hypothetical protein